MAEKAAVSVGPLGQVLFGGSRQSVVLLQQCDGVQLSLLAGNHEQAVRPSHGGGTSGADRLAPPPHHPGEVGPGHGRTQDIGEDRTERRGGSSGGVDRE